MSCSHLFTFHCSQCAMHASFHFLIFNSLDFVCTKCKLRTLATHHRWLSKNFKMMRKWNGKQMGMTKFIGPFDDTQRKKLHFEFLCIECCFLLQFHWNFYERRVWKLSGKILMECFIDIAIDKNWAKSMGKRLDRIVCVFSFALAMNTNNVNATPTLYIDNW